MGVRGPGARPVRAVRVIDAEATKPGKSRRKTGVGKKESRAQRVIAFLERLKITSGRLAGQNLVLEPWQIEVVEGIYAVGTDARRIVRTALLSLPRKVGKSTFAAGLALAHLAGPEVVPRGQVLSAGADRGQASFIYREIRAFALADPELGDALIFRDFVKSIEHVPSGSLYEALSADHRTAHGRSPSFYVADELAQWRGRELLDALETGGGAHNEPLGIIISTRSPNPDSPLEQMIGYGEATEDPAFFMRVWSAPLDADPFDEATWHAAIPGLGRVRSIEDVRAQATKAQGLPSAEAAFRAYVLNSPVAPDDRFIGAADWDACDGDAEPVGPCYAGLDLASGAADLTAVAMFWPETGLLRVKAFLPDMQLDAKAREDNAPYKEWVRAGLIVLIPGRAIDRSWLLSWLARETAGHDLKGLASDRWGLEDVKAVADREGIVLPWEPFGQGYQSMSPAISALEALVLDGALHHGGNPLLRWCVANAAVTMDPSGNRKLMKDRSRSRIDPLVAAVEAIGLAQRAPVPISYDFTGALLGQGYRI